MSTKIRTKGVYYWLQIKSKLIRPPSIIKTAKRTDQPRFPYLIFNRKLIVRFYAFLFYFSSILYRFFFSSRDKLVSFRIILIRVFVFFKNSSPSIRASTLCCAFAILSYVKRGSQNTSAFYSKRKPAFRLFSFNKWFYTLHTVNYIFFI